LKLSSRIFAIIGAPALLAGLMLSGAASSKPAVKAPPTGGTKFAIVNFTAVVIPGTTTFTIDSTSCDFFGVFFGEVEGDPCFLGGAGTLTNQGQPQTANVAITTPYGPISLSFVGLHSSCATATGLEAPNNKHVSPYGTANPFPLVAEMAGPLTLTKTGIVSGTICIFLTGTTTPLTCGLAIES
jgi:hypothetical protein